MGLVRVSLRTAIMNHQNQSKSSVYERLESRTLLSTAAIVTSVIADNRGLIAITFDKALQSKTVKPSNMRVFTPGADKTLGTADDVAVPVTTSWVAATNTALIKSDLVADTGYRVKLYSRKLIDGSGQQLDGEFDGSTLPSGNGVQGGNFEFRARKDTSSKPVVQITSNAGDIVMRLRGDVAPITAANFKAYANSGAYDGTVIHRNSIAEQTPPLYPLLAAGAYYQDNTAITALAPIQFEAGLLNRKGFVGMLRGNDADPDSATSGFFFNLANNNRLNPNNGYLNQSQVGYAVFGELLSGDSVLANVYRQPTTAFTGTTFLAPTLQGLNAQRVVFSRVAVRMRIMAV